METIEKIKEYIAQTAPAAISPDEAENYDATFSEALALADLIKETRLEGVALAIEYGQALGLRLGREEAQQQKRAEGKTATAAQVRDNFLITGDKLEARRNIYDAVDQT